MVCCKLSVSELIHPVKEDESDDDETGACRQIIDLICGKWKLVIILSGESNTSRISSRRRHCLLGADSNDNNIVIIYFWLHGMQRAGSRQQRSTAQRGSVEFFVFVSREK